MKLAKGWLLGLLAVGMGALAQGAVAQGKEDAEKQAQALVASLQFRDGEIAIPGAQARFRLDQTFRYLDGADARKVLEQLWGNPPDESVLGMVVPRGRGVLDDEGWAVVVTYSDEGYVSDDDAANTDYDELLQDMQAGTEDENEARKDAGYGSIELIGWAEPPHYDPATKKLYWAKELEFEGSKGHVLNYDIRVLGRRGYVSLNAVSGMAQLKDVQSGMQQLLKQVEFDQGARYADYDAKTDKMAAYGIAALIGGGLATKAGLFAKLGALLLGLKKLLIPLALLVLAFGKKLFGLLKREKSTATVS